MPSRIEDYALIGDLHTAALANTYVLQGRVAEARALFEKLLALRNDVGLLAEECDPVAHRQLGNFPQAFTHVALVNGACNLSHKNVSARQGDEGRHRSEVEG